MFGVVELDFVWDDVKLCFSYFCVDVDRRLNEWLVVVLGISIGFVFLGVDDFVWVVLFVWRRCAPRLDRELDCVWVRIVFIFGWIGLLVC